MFKPTPLEYYRQFRSIERVADVTFFTSKIDNLTTDLATHGIKFYYIKWSEKIVAEGPEFEYEYFCEDNSEELDNPHIYVSERHVFWASVEPIKAIKLQHHISDEHRDAVNAILFKHFPGRTLGYEHNSTTINIQVDPAEKLVPQDRILMLEVKLYYDESHHYPESKLTEMLDARINMQFASSELDRQEIFLEIAESLMPVLVSNIRDMVSNNTYISHFEIYDYDDYETPVDISKL